MPSAQWVTELHQYACSAMTWHPGQYGGRGSALRATDHRTPAGRHGRVTSCLVVTRCHYLPRARRGVSLCVAAVPQPPKAAALAHGAWNVSPMRSIDRNEITALAMIRNAGASSSPVHSTSQAAAKGVSPPITPRHTL